MVRGGERRGAPTLTASHRPSPPLPRRARQPLQHRAGLTLRFLILPRGIAVGHDAGTGLHMRAPTPENRGAERDGRIEGLRPPTDVPARAGLGPAPSRLP